MANFDALRKRVTERAIRAVDNAAQQVWAETVDATPVRTGYMAENVRITAEDPSRARLSRVIRCDVPYASFVDRGTRPYIIYPKRRGGLLVFDVGATTVFTRKPVHHPGITARNFFSKPMPERWQNALSGAYGG